MNEKAEKETWPDFAIVLFDLLTGRKAELTWEFENLGSTFRSQQEPARNMPYGNSTAC